MIEEDIKELIRGQSQISQKVDDMHGRLFGNGQPGLIQHLHTQSESLEAKINDITLKIATSDAQKAGQTALDARQFRNTVLKYTVPAVATAAGAAYELAK